MEDHWILDVFAGIVVPVPVQVLRDPGEGTRGPLCRMPRGRVTINGIESSMDSFRWMT